MCVCVCVCVCVPVSRLLSPIPRLLSPVAGGQTLEGDAAVARLEAAVQSKRAALAAVVEDNLQHQLEEEDLVVKTSERSALSLALSLSLSR